MQVGKVSILLMDRFKSDHEIESGMPATPGDFCLDGFKQGVAWDV